MKASEIKVSLLKDYIECAEAIELIENDYHNVVGGIKAWLSGWQTDLTPAAKKKIAAIEKHMDKFLPDDEEGM